MAFDASSAILEEDEEEQPPAFDPTSAAPEEQPALVPEIPLSQIAPPPPAEPAEDPFSATLQKTAPLYQQHRDFTARMRGNAAAGVPPDPIQATQFKSEIESVAKKLGVDPTVAQKAIADHELLDFSAHAKPAGVLSNGAVVVRPELAFDETAWKTAVDSTGASDLAKQQAMVRRLEIKESVAEDLYPMLSRTKKFQEFETKNEAKYKTTGELVEAFRAENAGPMENLGTQSVAGAKAGFHGLSKSIYGAGAMVFRGGVIEQMARQAATDESEQGQIAHALGGGAWVGKLTAGAMSLAPAFAGGAAGKVIGLGAKAALGAQAGVAGMQSLGSTYIAALNANLAKGLGPEEARNRSIAPALASGLVTGLITRGFSGGVEAVASGVGREALKASLSDGIAGFAKHLGRSVTGEAIEEATDQLMQGVIEANSYNPKKTLTEILSELIEAGILGGVLGGAANIASVLSERQGRAAADAQKARIEEAGAPASAAAVAESPAVAEALQAMAEAQQSERVPIPSQQGTAVFDETTAVEEISHGMETADAPSPGQGEFTAFHGTQAGDFDKFSLSFFGRNEHSPSFPHGLFFSDTPLEVYDTGYGVGSNRRYKVAIKASQDELLDLDKSYISQSDLVLNALKKSGVEFSRLNKSSGLVEDARSGRDIYNFIARQAGGPEAASKLLHDLGVKGATHTTNEGKNFTIFDEDSVRILSKENMDVRAPEPIELETKPAVVNQAALDALDKLEALLADDVMDEVADEAVAPEPQEPEPMTETEVAATPLGEAPTPQEVALEGLTLSEEVPQFKAGADAKGVVEPLSGKFAARGVGAIQIWERKDGRREVISGRHRLDLAQRTPGKKTILGQIYREADGFTVKDAAVLDAELNIRDDHGSTADYAQYFKHAELSEQEAAARNLLGSAKGRSGFLVGTQGSTDVLALHRSGALTDSQAAGIASAAPGNAAAQRIGTRAALEGKSASDVKKIIGRALDKTSEGGKAPSWEQIDLLGESDAAMVKMAEEAKFASAQQRDIRAQIKAVEGAATNPEAAKKLGVDASNPAEILAKVQQLRLLEARWDQYWNHKELIAKIEGKEEVSISQPSIEEAKLDTPKPPELMTPEERVIAVKESLPSLLSEWSTQHDGSYWLETIYEQNVGEKAPKSSRELVRFFEEHYEKYPEDMAKDLEPFFKRDVFTAISDGKPVSDATVDAYGIKLPEGYVREGDRYVYKQKPEQPVTPSPAKPTGKLPVAKRAKDFEFSGAYEAEVGGKTRSFYRDPESRNWYLKETRKNGSPILLSTGTKEEALTDLVRRFGETPDFLAGKPDEPFNLVGETKAEKAAREKAAQASADQAEAKAIAEAKAKQDKQQGDMFGDALDRAIENLKGTPGLLTDPLFIQSVGKPLLRAALQIVRAGIKVGKSVVQAIEEGIAYLRTNVPKIDEDDARAFFNEVLNTEPPPAPPVRPTAPEGQPSPTGIRNAITDRDRVAKGLPPRMEPLRKKWGKAWDEAMALVDEDAAAGRKLVDSIIKEPRPLTDTEIALLSHEKVVRENVFDNAVAAVNRLPDSPDRQAKLQALDVAREDNQTLYAAAELSGSEQGRGLAARKMMIERDYTLAEMEAEWRALVNNGDPLTDGPKGQKADVAKLHAELEATKQKLAEIEAKEEAAAVKHTYAQVLADMGKQVKASAKAGKSLLEALKEGADSSREALRKMIEEAQKLRAVPKLPSIDPTVLFHVARIGAYHFVNGLTKFAEWTVAMKNELGSKLFKLVEPDLPEIFEGAKEHAAAADKLFEKGKKGRKPPETPGIVKQKAKDISEEGEELTSQLVGELVLAHIHAGVHGEDAVMAAVHADLLEFFHELTERDVRRAFTEYGKVRFPSRDADKTERRELRTIVRLQESIDRLLEGMDALHTGLQRDKATQAVREKQKLLNELLKARQGPPSPEKLASREEARITALQNQIADINLRLKTGEKPLDRAPLIDSPEIERLKAERNAMMAKVREIEAAENPKLSDEEKANARAIRGAEKSIIELDRRIRAGEVTAARAPGAAPSPELERLRAERAAMRAHLNEMRAAATPKLSAAEKQMEKLGKIKTRLDQLLSGNITAKTPAEFIPLSQAADDIKAEILALQQLAVQMRRDAKPSTDKEAGKERAQIKALETAIERYQQKTAAADFSPPGKRHGPDSKRVTQLKEIRDSRREAYLAAKKAGMPVRTPEQIKLARDIKSINTRIAKIEARIAVNDYTIAGKPVPVNSPEKEAAQFRMHKIKEQYARGLFNAQLAKRTKLQKVWGGAQEGSNLSRAIMTGGEFSAMLRQGAVIAFGQNPFRTAKAAKAMFSAFRSEANQFRIMEEIRNRENARNGLYAQSKLFFHDERTTDLSKMEEKFQSRLAEHVPVIGGSQRAYTTFLNVLRADKFDTMARCFGRGGKPTLDQGKFIANFINVATGRGLAGLGQKASTIADAISSFLFAGRLVASRFQLIAMEPIWNPLFKAGPRERALLAAEYGKTLIGLSSMIALAALGFGLGDDDDENTLAIPSGFFTLNSSDFGKIRVGNTRLDLMAGLAQVIVFLARLGTGELTKPDEDYPTRLRSNEEEDAKQGAMSRVIQQFVRSKLAPLPQFAWTAITGETYAGKPAKILPSEIGFPPDSAVGELLVSMTSGDIVDAIVAEGIPRGIALSMYAFFGAGLNTYAED